MQSNVTKINANKVRDLKLNKIMSGSEYILFMLRKITRNEVTTIFFLCKAEICPFPRANRWTGASTPTANSRLKSNKNTQDFSWVFLFD